MGLLFSVHSFKRNKLKSNFRNVKSLLKILHRIIYYFGVVGPQGNILIPLSNSIS